MKVLPITSLLISLSVVGCSDSISNIKQRHDYDEVSKFEIKYDEIFDFDHPLYFIYFYSLHCLHCELIKDDVISYSLLNKVPMKFISYYDEIPILEDVSETIGAKNLDNLGILGTPGLMLIANHEVTLNIAGGELIKNVLKEYY